VSSTVIFGGAGFVGLAIAEALLARGHRVTLADRRPPPARFPACESMLVDVTRPEDVARALHTRPEFVVWGAAITADAAREAADPARILSVNLVGLAHALKASAAAGVRRVVNLSSASAYGEAAFGDGPDLREDDRIEPLPLYGLTKASGEVVARRLASLLSLDVRSVRLSGVWGPWEHRTGLRDTLSPQWQIAKALREGRPALLPRAGERDWVYVRDVAGAVATLLHAPAPGRDLYNVSPGVRSSPLALGGRLAGPGEAATIELHGERDRRPLDPARIAADLGWRAAWPADRAAEDYRRWLADNAWALD
jgi:UDP-glucose 4-epimerase